MSWWLRRGLALTYKVSALVTLGSVTLHPNWVPACYGPLLPVAEMPWGDSRARTVRLPTRGDAALGQN